MRSLLSFVAGAVAAGFLWFYATPAYDAFLSHVGTVLLDVDPRLRACAIERDERVVRVRSTENLAFPTAMVPASELTYNVMLFAGLVAYRRGSWRRTLVAALVLVASHVVALVVSVEAVYATRQGPWSDAHYGGGEQDFWTAAEYLYRLAGMFGIAFAAWWLSVNRAESAPSRQV